jgi:PHP family Zn ribbon phosphoesterase
MKNSISYDFHIHSCLSPCGDNDMTPCNIAGMAFVKKLDAIALTDHNSCRNCVSTKKVADRYGVLFVPGMELTTVEEIHVLCYFPTVEKAIQWDKYVYSRLQKIDNRPEIFGQQLILDENDDIVEQEDKLLINATNITFDEVFSIIQDYGGVAVPAHIDKNSNSLISQLGFVPENSTFSCFEVKDISSCDFLCENNPYLKTCNVLTSSDAHYLVDINEPINFIDIEEYNIPSILNYISNKE